MSMLIATSYSSEAKGTGIPCGACDATLTKLQWLFCLANMWAPFPSVLTVTNNSASGLSMDSFSGVPKEPKRHCGGGGGGGGGGASSQLLTFLVHVYTASKWN